MIKVQKLKVKFSGTVALNIERPFEISKGDRIGIIGANGAGKSTLINALLGIQTYEGEIKSEISAREMAVHLQENNYSEHLTVKNILEMILDTKLLKNEKLLELISFFEFEDCLKKKYEKLSGGQKQRLTLILVLMQESKITFFDEVTSGLDFETRKMLINKLRTWYNKSDSAICFVSHYYDELDFLVNKLLILDRGTIVDFDTVDNLFAKYCGYSIIILEKTPENLKYTENVEMLSAPAHLIVIKCNNLEEESRVINYLVERNINFKRSNQDIEILSFNAIRSTGEEFDEQ
ncbi:MAG: ATP-binding cassette domain-containing protein [Mycoplasmatales bacterium]